MKKLIKYVAYLSIILVIISFLFESIYTHYSYQGTIRDKVKWVKSSENPMKYDYIILGSSRTLNFLNPVQIDSLTGLSGINLGLDASGPLEIKLMLKEYLKKGNPKTVFIQTDYRTALEPDKIGSVVWMPYIKEKEIFNEFKPYGQDYYYLKNIPLYRFLEYGSKIGTRNIFLTISGKENDIMKNKGFEAVNGKMDGNQKAAATIREAPNSHLLEIEAICKRRNIKVHFFTSPIYNSPFDFSFYGDYLKNYKDFSKSINNKDLFFNVTHLNADGAALFTNTFVDYYFQ